jgi:lipopolysaccharide/colanic/teichoic acid biosynthesis glycosyltransferase
MSSLSQPEFDTMRFPRSLQRSGSWQDALKRALDIAGAAVGLTLLGPVMLCCGAWIWLVDGRPITYRQWRVGRDGWMFVIYKFRTMRQDAEADGACFAASSDPRVMPGCSWMRKSHVDELPQLLNILWGHMSLVGPRPERPEMIEDLRGQIPAIDLRLASRPGLTGLAQVRNGYTNDVAGMRRKVAWDLRLVMATFPKFWDHGAC